jgi:predicted transposase/invertase (TIGR01784 family)
MKKRVSVFLFCEKRRFMNEQTKVITQETPEKKEFIMLPTVDFCFKELMQNAKVRQGMIAALLGVEPEKIERTELLPTILHTEYPDEKYGILDVKVILKDETQMDFEMQVTAMDYWTKRILFYLGKMYTGQLKAGESYEKLKKCIHVGILDFIHFPDDDRCYRKIIFCDKDTGEEYTDLLDIHVLELEKLPKEEQDESGIIRWMRFLGAKSREEFEKMAKEDSYIDEAYEMLKHMSADEKKRLEYEAREKAIRDYNSQIQSAEEKGEKRGEQRKAASIITNMLQKGKTPEEIADVTGECLEDVLKIQSKEYE